MSGVPEFWHVSYPVLDSGGRTYNYWQEIGVSEQDARDIAVFQSRRHGHANVTDRTGLVATYIGGEEIATPGPVADPVHDGYVDRAAEARADQRGEDGAR